MNDTGSVGVRDFNRRVQDVVFSKKNQTKMSERSIYLKIDGCMHPLPKIDGCSCTRRTRSNEILANKETCPTMYLRNFITFLDPIVFHSTGLLDIDQI